MANDNDTFELPEHVMLRTVGDEMVLLNFESERYFGLDDVGADFLRLLTAHKSRAQAFSHIANLYDVDHEVLNRDLDALLDSLLGAGLLEKMGK